MDTVALLQGRGNIERIADGRDDDGLGSEASHRVRPEREQATDSRIFHCEEPAIAEFALQYRLRVVAKSAGDRRGIPARIEPLPIVPGRPRGRQDTIVQFPDRGVLPEPPFVVRSGLRYRSRQGAAEQTQHPGHCGGAAAVHAGHQYHTLPDFPDFPDFSVHADVSVSPGRDHRGIASRCVAGGGKIAVSDHESVEFRPRK